MDVHNNDGSPLFDLCLMSTLAIFQLYNGKVCGICYHYYINLVKKIGASQKNDKLLINYLNIYFQITNILLWKLLSYSKRVLHGQT